MGGRRMPCGKIGYPTASAAHRAQRALKRFRHKGECRACRCRDCTSANGGVAVWHLTSWLIEVDDFVAGRFGGKKKKRF